MAIKMTRAQYQERYGATPTSTTPTPTTTPVKMTRAQYASTYGSTPKDDTKMTLGGFAENLGSSAIKTGGDILGAAVNTFNPNPDENTLVNIGKLGLGAAQLAIPGEQGLEEGARNVGRFYKQRYGGIENIKKTLYEDPVGAAMDVSTVAGIVGAGAKAANLSKVANIAGKVEAVANPVNIASKIASPVTSRVSPIFSKAKIAKKLEATSEGLVTKGLGQPQELKKIKGVSGMPVSELFEKFNLYERTPEAATEAIRAVNKEYKNLVGGSVIKKSDILSAIDEEISVLKNKAKFSNTAKTQLKEVTSRRKAINKNLPEEISGERFLEVKRQIASDIPERSFGTPTDELAKAGGTKTVNTKLIDVLANNAKGTKELGRQEAALIKTRKLFENAQARSSARQNLNFTKMAGAGVGGVLGGIPGAAAGYVAEQVANSPKFLKMSSKLLKGAGKTLKKAKTPKVFGKSAKFGARVRLFSDRNKENKQED